MKKTKTRICLGAIAIAITFALIMVWNVPISTRYLPTPIKTGTNAQYNTNGFADVYEVNYLKGTDKVIYSFGENNFFLMGDNAGEAGTCYWDVFSKEVPNDAKLISASNKYVVFETGSGKIAMETKETFVEEEKRYYHKIVEFDELSWIQKIKLHEVEKTEIKVKETYSV